MTTMATTDFQADLNAVNNQLTTLVEELNKMNASREQLVQQIQNLSGVAMYLRGKLPPEDGGEETTPVQESVERTDEYPDS